MAEPVRERSWWDRFWRNEHGDVVILQAPNPPLLGWLVFMVAAKLFRDGSAHAGLAFLSQAFLFTWAYLEVRSGDNGFRRLLGALAAISIVVAHFR